MKICKVEGCNNKHSCKGYCSKHYDQMRFYGKILKRTRFDTNKIIDCGSYCEIILYEYNPHAIETARAKINKDDLIKVKKYKWSICNRYVRCNSKNIFLHQLILGKKRGYIIDHINTNPLDNRKQNLRHCTKSQNGMNRKIKGYWWYRKNKKWIVEIVKNKQKIYLGGFKTEQDAILARRQAEQKHFKEFAYRY